MEYNRRLKACNAMDFDDLLFYTNTLFKKHEDVLRKYQDIFDIGTSKRIYRLCIIAYNTYSILWFC